MKVADAPAHIGLVPVVCAMATDGTRTGLMVMVVPALVAVVEVTQVAFEVMIQVTTWLFVNVVEVKVAPVAAFTPFTCHW